MVGKLGFGKIVGLELLPLLPNFGIFIILLIRRAEVLLNFGMDLSLR